MLGLDNTDLDLRISRPFGRQSVGRNGTISPSASFLLKALREFRDGERTFYMTAIDPPNWDGLARDVLTEQVAELRDCDFVHHDLVYWERPFRVDGDWCSPGVITDRGLKLLDRVQAGYVCSIETVDILQAETRAFYASHLRWADIKGMAALSKMRDPWLADLRRCVRPVRRGYAFLPGPMRIDLEATRRNYLHPLLSEHRLSRTSYDVVRRMNDPRMADILAAMISFIVGGDYDEEEDCWRWPRRVDLPFDDLTA